MGDSISILIGRLLGAGELERAVDEDRKLIAFSILLSLLVTAAVMCVAPLIPRLYNTTDSVRWLAVRLLMIWAAFTPLHAYANACYFTLRSGGKTMITFAFDSLFTWVFQIPLAFCLSRFTGVPILEMYALVEGMALIKCVIGALMLRSRMWAVNLVQ